MIVKRRYHAEWGDDWEKYFSVDSVNGQPANELRFKGEKLITRLLRVGFDENGSWRLFALRKDFIPAQKILAEDDITVSTVAPLRLLNEIGPVLSRNLPSLFIIANIVYFSDRMMLFIVVSTNKRRRIYLAPEILSVILNVWMLKMRRIKFQVHLHSKNTLTP